MASKASFPQFTFFLSLNLLFFTVVTACTCPSPPEPVPTPYPKPTPTPTPTPSPYPKPTPPSIPYYPPPPSHEKCPRNVLKIGLCAKLLNSDLLEIIIGKPPVTPCCKLIKGLVDLEAAVCLCTSIKASILGMKADLSVSLELLLNNCGRKTPPGYKCAY